LTPAAMTSSEGFSVMAPNSFGGAMVCAHMQSRGDLYHHVHSPKKIMKRVSETLQARDQGPRTKAAR
jgi:hypothetical protein